MAFVQSVNAPLPSSRLSHARALTSLRKTATSRPRWSMSDGERRRRVTIVGGGWAGLGAAYALAKSLDDCDVTLLDAAPSVGGLVAGWTSKQGKSVEVGVHGMWYRYYNIFHLVRTELGLRPFTPWTRSSQRSPKGKVVESPIFQDMPWLPTPLGTFVYTKFLDLPLVDRLSAMPLLDAVVEWDSSDEMWKKYDSMTAKELFKMYGCSERVYKEAFDPMLRVGLFASGDQCSAAGARGMLSFFILHSTPAFDVVWPRGTVSSLIFSPWVKRLESLGVTIKTSSRVSDLVSSENDEDVIGGVMYSAGSPDGPVESMDTDAVIFAVGISGMQNIVRSSKTLASRAQFRNTMNLSAIDVVAVRLYFDRLIKIEFASNACFGFPEHESGTGWTYFDLNEIHDEFRDANKTVIEADFYHANQYLAAPDDEIIAEVLGMLRKAEASFIGATVEDYSVVRIPRGVTHFRTGSYQDFLPCQTEFKNVFAAGDWIKGSKHASFSQEKALVTGYEAANAAMTYLGYGSENHAAIIPLEPDEPHILAARELRKGVRRFASLLPGSKFFMS
jgi:uncharacterized protein with NAD-binding domain and iron-sulfur cluster